MRRVNYIDEVAEEEESPDNEEHLVPQIDGRGSKSFYMEGMTCEMYFKAISDTGSRVSNFKKRDLKKIIGERKVVISDMIKDGSYVDYKKKPLDLLGYQF